MLLLTDSGRRALERRSGDEVAITWYRVPVDDIVLNNIVCVISGRRIPCHFETIAVGRHNDILWRWC